MNQQGQLISYRYDALDRLIGVDPTGAPASTRVYREGRIATQLEGQKQHSLMHAGGHVLAQSTRTGNTVVNSLLGCDQQGSVLQSVTGDDIQHSTYTPYGDKLVQGGLQSLLGFNGEQPDPVTGCYLLGNGYRAYNPVLMRFHSPDSMSPFDSGGINPYAYCVGDPVNLSDPTGHFSFKRFFKALLGVAISVAAISITAVTLGAGAPLTGPLIFMAALSITADVVGIAGNVASAIDPDSKAGGILGYVGLGLGFISLSGSQAAKFAASRGSQMAARFVNKGAGAVTAARQGVVKVSKGRAVPGFSGTAKLGKGARNTVALQNRFELAQKLTKYVEPASWAFGGYDFIDDLVSRDDKPSGTGESRQSPSTLDAFVRGDTEQGPANIKPGDLLYSSQGHAIREF